MRVTWEQLWNIANISSQCKHSSKTLGTLWFQWAQAKSLTGLWRSSENAAHGRFIDEMSLLLLQVEVDSVSICKHESSSDLSPSVLSKLPSPSFQVLMVIFKLLKPRATCWGSRQSSRLQMSGLHWTALSFPPPGTSIEACIPFSNPLVCSGFQLWHLLWGPPVFLREALVGNKSHLPLPAAVSWGLPTAPSTGIEVLADGATSLRILQEHGLLIHFQSVCCMLSRLRNRSGCFL